MAYARENDELRPEVRLDTGGTIRFWPKVDGHNVLASAVGGECFYTIHKPDGTTVVSQTNVTPTTVGSDSRMDFTVSTAVATPLDEGYQVRITWQVSGASLARFDVVTFDVVRWPYGPLVSFNDLLEEQADAAEILDRLGVLLGYTTGSDAQENAAAICAHKARIRSDRLIRNAIRSSATTYASSFTGLVRDSRHTRPNLILDRTRLVLVERKLAMAELHGWDGGTDDGEDRPSQLMRRFERQADEAWSNIGPLDYDAVEDLVADQTLTDLGRIFHTRRVQS